MPDQKKVFVQDLKFKVRLNLIERQLIAQVQKLDSIHPYPRSEQHVLTRWAAFQCDQIGQNFSIWATFMRKSSPRA